MMLVRASSNKKTSILLHTKVSAELARQAEAKVEQRPLLAYTTPSSPEKQCIFERRVYMSDEEIKEKVGKVRVYIYIYCHLHTTAEMARCFCPCYRKRKDVER